jgi:hypothetical protein
VLLLKLEGAANLVVFISNEFIIHITIGVFVCEDFEGFFGSVVVDEPSRAFGYEEKMDKDDSGGEGLEETGCSPSPLSVRPRKRAVAEPGGNDLAYVVVTVVGSGDVRSETGMSEFLEQGNTSDLAKRSSSTDYDTTTDESS